MLIAMHGWRSGWSNDFGLVADFWQASGCSVLYAEQRGQGDSGGAYMGFGMLERYDCLAWARWAAEETGNRLPMYLVGLSMGATTVLMCADMELPMCVRGILADCGFTSAGDIWEHVARSQLKLPYGLYGPAAEALCKKRIDMDPRACSTEKTLAGAKVPVLLIHGTEDAFVPVEMTYRNYQACTAPKGLLIVPGAEHAMSYCTDPQRYQAAVLKFWDAYDAG